MFLPIVGLLLVVALLGGAIAYQTHAVTAYETEEEVVSSWSETTTVSHQAQVVRPNLVFDPNRIVANQPAYFTQLSPELQGVHQYRFQASDEGSVDVDRTASLRIRSVDGDGAPYWQRTELLAEDRVAGVSPGEAARMSVDLNVTDAVREIERTEASIGSSIGRSEIAIVFDTTVRGTVNGESIATAHRDSLVLRPDDATYRVEASEGNSGSYERTEEFSVPVVYGPIRSYGPFFLIGGAILSAVGLASVRHWRGIGPSEETIALVEWQAERAAFEEWISRASVPDDALRGSAIELDSLEAVVDVAIDTRNRVFEDVTRDAFYVLDDDRHYVYVPEILSAEPEPLSEAGGDDTREVGHSGAEAGEPAGTQASSD